MTEDDFVLRDPNVPELGNKPTDGVLSGFCLQYLQTPRKIFSQSLNPLSPDSSEEIGTECDETPPESPYVTQGRN